MYRSFRWETLVITIIGVAANSQQHQVHEDLQRTVAIIKAAGGGTNASSLARESYDHHHHHLRYVDTLEAVR